MIQWCLERTHFLIWQYLYGIFIDYGIFIYLLAKMITNPKNLEESSSSSKWLTVSLPILTS